MTLPPDAGRIVLLQSGQLSAAQSAVKLLRLLALPLRLLALAVFALAVYLARTPLDAPGDRVRRARRRGSCWWSSGACSATTSSPR